MKKPDHPEIGRDMSQFAYDEIGLLKRLRDGRVLRVHAQIYNFKLTLSASEESPTWEHGW